MRKRLAPFAALLLMAGCSPATTPVLDPVGPIASVERNLIVQAFLIMLVVVVPVIFLTLFFAWRYRASAPARRYVPQWFSGGIDKAIWAVPVIIVAVLAVHAWQYTHRLDPYRPLDGGATLTIDVIAQDWKWLFVYPDAGIAVVNELAIPVGVPVLLRITSDSVMNSLSIPALAGQIYAMAGMATQLNIRSDETGTFIGRNTQYNGDGFPDQNFAVRSLSAEDFAAWIATAQTAPQPLNATAYEALVVPSEKHPVTYYAGVVPNLFETVIAKYSGPPLPDPVPAHPDPVGVTTDME